MDNGPLQREQAWKIKGIVNSNRRRRRMLRSALPLPNTSPDTEYEERFSASNASYKSSAEDVIPHISDMVMGDWAEFHDWDMDLDIMNEGILGEPSKENLLTTELFFNNCDRANDICIDNISSGGHGPSQPGGCRDSEALPTPPPSRSGQLAYGIFQEETHLEAISASSAEWQWSSHWKPAKLHSAKNAVKESPILPAYPIESVDCGDREDELFIYYLDVVFYVQYPFFDSSHKQSRTWLFSILKRARSAYHAMLAVSERHKQSTTESSLHWLISNQPNYYDIAVREMELIMGDYSSMSGTAGLTCCTEALTCILQLLFCEVCRYPWRIVTLIVDLVLVIWWRHRELAAPYSHSRALRFVTRTEQDEVIQAKFN